MSDATEPSASEASPLLRFIRLFARVEAPEVPLVVWAFVANFCLLGAWYAMRPLRETFGVRAGDSLAELFTGTFASSLVFLPIYLALVTWLGRRALAPVFYGFSALCLVAFYVLFLVLDEEGDRIAGMVFFVWVSTYVLFAGTLFWSLLVDLHTSDESKRLFGFIFAGGTAGGLISSGLVALIAEPLGTDHVFVFPIVLLVGLVLALGRLDAAVRRRSAEDPTRVEEAERTTAPVGGNPLEGLRQVMRSPYLAGICLYMFFTTFAGTVLYFEQKDIVRAAVASEDARTSLFGWINFGTQSITVVGQALVHARLVRRMGLVAALVALPALYVVGLVALGVAAVLPVIVALQVVLRGISFSLAKPSKEILFTVVGRDAKYKSKGFIDTVVYRGGDALSGWCYDGLRWVGLSLSGVALAAAPLCLAWSYLCVRLGRRQERLEREQRAV